MKSKLFINKNALIALAIFLTIVITTLFASPVSHGHEAAVDISDRERLHLATIATSVSNDNPAITILMHGLGGGPDHWSNNFTGTHGDPSNFSRDSDSLIEQMRSSSAGINLYVADAISASNVNLYYDYGMTKVTSIFSYRQHNSSLHTVILMKVETYGYMKDVYDRVHYAIDTITNDYYSKNGSLPCINLIGHSMGGLINMQYAIDHPKNVTSLVSLGTPYNGSWYDNWFVNIIFKQFEDQPCMSGDCGHSYYFCNLTTRKNTWNSVYSQNTHINFHALSGETSISLMEHIVWTNNYLEDYFGVGWAIGVRSTFLSHWSLNLIGGVLPGDVCVDTDSQRAKGYNGAINYNKRFTTSNSDVNKRTTDQPPVPHNLETYDKDMQHYILRVINYGSTKTYQSYTKNGMKASIINKSGDKWMILLTNQTGSTRSFDYNTSMCFDEDAKTWNGLGHINSTVELVNGASTTLEITEYLAATAITISYTNGNYRYIHYANNLSTATTMSSYGASKSYNKYTQNGMTVSIVSKYFGQWTFQLTNSTGVTRAFDYNSKMCFEGDAQNWKGLTDVVETVKLAPGKSTYIEIIEHGTANSIAISYMDGDYRKIFYARTLSTSGTMNAMANTIDTTLPPPSECIVEGSLITLADGSQKAVEELTGDEMLLVWNLQTGAFDVAPILFIDSDAVASYEVIELEFSDGTEVEVIYEHGFWDITLNRYVYLRNDAEDYIGHWFNKQSIDENGNMIWTQVQLEEVEIEIEQTTAWSPVTAVHLCYYVNGMLSMPGGIEGLFNIFEVDSATMKYDAEAMAEDIATYGLFTYEEFSSLVEISQDVFDAFGGQYMKVAIGKGQIDMQTIASLLDRYSEFLN